MSYILFIRSLVEAQSEEGEISESELEYILKEEGEALKNPKPSSPELILIEGGKSGDNSNEDGRPRATGRRKETRS